MGPKKKSGGKKGGKKAGKKKEPDYQTDDPFLFDHFGLRVRDIVRTPLGMEGEVLGVKTPDKENPSTWRLWLQYQNGFKAPVDPKNKEEMAIRGYRKASEAKHVIRDMEVERIRRAKFEEGQRKIMEAEAKKRKDKLLEQAVEERKNNKGKKGGGKRPATAG